MAHVPAAPIIDLDVLSCMERILDMCNKYNLILQAEETLSSGKSLSKELQEVLRSKSSVVHQLDLLHEFLKGNPFQFVTGSASTPDFPIKEVDPAAIRVARGRLRVVEDQLNTLMSKARGLPDMEVAPVHANDSGGLSKEESETKEVDETLPLDKPRYLYVSDGLVLCCLDLQQSKCQPHEYKDADSVPGLPKVSILRMLDKGDPISAGLFKSGSDVYIIGGQVLPPGYPDVSDVRVWRRKPRESEGSDVSIIRGEFLPPGCCPYASDFRVRHFNLWGTGLYKFLIKKHGFNGSTCSIHRLSRAGCTLSLSGCSDIPELKEPKVWPIVEKIEDEIHVMSSLPFLFPGCDSTNTFSHEFLNIDEVAKGWTQVSPAGLGSKLNISSHLVVDDHIYASGRKNVVMIYESDAKKWITRRKRRDFHPFFIKHVWEFLDYGWGRCAGEFLDLELFVVIAVVRDVAAMPRDDSAHAVAYLVTSWGRVICFQRLPNFYEERLRPCLVKVATVIKVDELGKTMCAIVHGRRACGDDFDQGRYLFINTFTVEGLTHVCAKVQEMKQQMNMNKYFCAVEMEFVRVVVKDNYLYKMDKVPESNPTGCDLPEFPLIQAWFP